MPADFQLRVRVDTSQFDRAIRDYAEVRKMDLAHALERSGKKFCYRLAAGYARFAATTAKIWQEAETRQWFTLIRKGPYAGNVLRKPNAVVNAELERRARAAKFLSGSFLIRGWRVAKGGVRRLYSKAGGKSRVFVETDSSTPRVVIASELDGVIAMDQSHAIWSRALQEETADLNEYLRRKEHEAAELFNR